MTVLKKNAKWISAGNFEENKQVNISIEPPEAEAEADYDN